MHIFHVSNSTYCDAEDLEFHMSQIHGLEKTAPWSLKVAGGYRCRMCNAFYKIFADLEFHVEQFHHYDPRQDVKEVPVPQEEQAVEGSARKRRRRGDAPADTTDLRSEVNGDADCNENSKENTLTESSEHRLEVIQIKKEENPVIFPEPLIAS